MRRWLTPVALLFLSVLSSFFSIPPASAATWTVHAQPTRLVNGGPILFQVKPPARLESLSGTWLGHHVSFSFDAKTKAWFALVGVSLETAPELTRSRVSRSQRTIWAGSRRSASGRDNSPHRAEAAISDVFGSEHIFNGKTSSPTRVCISECPAELQWLP